VGHICHVKGKDVDLDHKAIAGAMRVSASRTTMSLQLPVCPIPLSNQSWRLTAIGMDRVGNPHRRDKGPGPRGGAGCLAEPARGRYEVIISAP